MSRSKLRTREDTERVMLEHGHTLGQWRMGGGGRYPVLECTTCSLVAVIGDRFVYGSAIDQECSHYVGEAEWAEQ